MHMCTYEGAKFHQKKKKTDRETQSEPAGCDYCTEIAFTAPHSWIWMH